MQTATLTNRLAQPLRDTLKATAARLRTSESEFISELLAREFGQAPYGQQASELIVCVASRPSTPARPDAFRKAIKRTNWRANLSA